MDFPCLSFLWLGVLEAQDAAMSSDGNLRQARLLAEFWQHGGGACGFTLNTEWALHALFEAQVALCDGRRGELSYGALCCGSGGIATLSCVLRAARV